MNLYHTFKDLEFCIETLGMNDDQINEMIEVTEDLGVRPRYFADEFIFVTGRGVEEDSKLHDPDYLNIAVFNATHWEG